METIGDLFRVPTSQWGLRGDPYLWEEMRIVFKPVPLPDSADSLQAMIEAAFFVLTSHPINTDEEFFIVDRFKGGGMSSGGVCPLFWREKVIPLIIERFAASTNLNCPPPSTQLGEGVWQPGCHSRKEKRDFNRPRGDYTDRLELSGCPLCLPTLKRNV